MIDLHCHVLPGIDDGPRDLEGSLALCRRAASLGVGTIVATPHVSWTYENSAADISRRVADLNGELRSREIELEILPGAEVAISKAIELDDSELRDLTLGGGPWLLAEPPFAPAAAGLSSMIHGLLARGHQLLLAHPERCPTYLRDRAELEHLVAEGVLVSITAGSLVGRFGKEVMRFAGGLVRDGLVHNVASDAHGSERRPPGMRAELEQARFGAHADWLCEQVPRALLDGTSLPPAPELAARRGPLARLFRA